MVKINHYAHFLRKKTIMIMVDSQPYSSCLSLILECPTRNRYCCVDQIFMLGVFLKHCNTNLHEGWSSMSEYFGAFDRFYIRRLIACLAKLRMFTDFFPSGLHFTQKTLVNSSSYGLLSHTLCAFAEIFVFLLYVTDEILNNHTGHVRPNQKYNNCQRNANFDIICRTSISQWA